MDYSDLSSRRIEQAQRLKKLGMDNFVLSLLACSAAAVILATIFDSLFHWFLIPVVLCGALIGNDAIKWFRKGTDTFEPVAVFGLYGVYFFFISPILHVCLDVWMKYVTHPTDWRPWLGYMALLNLLGLMVMILVRDHLILQRDVGSPKKLWIVDKKRFLRLLPFFLVISFLLQIYIYISQGGLTGYIAAYTEGQTDVFQGMGLVFMISESFPILALIGFAVYAKGKAFLTSWPVLIIVLSVFAILQMLFGGLRGSRSNTVFNIIWAVGIIHFWLRPIPRRMIMLGLILIVFFMYIYGFYKGAGLEVAKSRQVVY